MTRLPFLISVPHSGLTIPEEVRPLCRLNRDEIRNDSDGGAGVIYSMLKDHVQCFVIADIARAVVDLNRPEDDFSKDGVIKTHTCWDVPIWSSPLPKILCDTLLEKYYYPYHQKLASLAGDPSLVLGIDCHTMAATGPPVGPDPGEERPFINLGNVGNKSCPEKWAMYMVYCFKECFGDNVTLNHPFKGGWITRHYSRLMPWIQIEISRAPFLTDSEKSLNVLSALKMWAEKFHNKADSI
jgi:formiminoglutamase